MWPALPAVISAVASIGSAIYNNITNKKQANKQNQWNLNMWNKTNQYNDPASQMNRLKQAGMNPNMYGTQIISNNSAASAPSSADLANQNPIVDQAAAANLADAVGNLEVGQKNAEANMKSAQAAETNAEANSLNAQTNQARQQVDALVAAADIKLKGAEKERCIAQVSQINQQITNLKKEFEILDEKSKQEVIETARKTLEQDLYEKYGEKQILAELNLKNSQAHLNMSQAHLAEVNASLAPIFADAAKEQAAAATTNAEANFLNSQTNIATAQKSIEKMDQEIETLKSQGKLNEAQADFFRSWTVEKILGIALSAVGSFGGIEGKRKGMVQRLGQQMRVRNATPGQRSAGQRMAHPTGSYRNSAQYARDRANNPNIWRSTH